MSRSTSHVKPERVFSVRRFRPVGKCDWCSEDERALRAAFLPWTMWLCGACYCAQQHGEFGVITPLVGRGE